MFNRFRSSPEFQVYNLVTLNLPFADDASHYFKRLCSLSGCVWLHSGGEVTANSRYDILTALPSATTTETDPDKLTTELNSRFSMEMHDEPAREIALPFTGGWIGFFAYQFNHARYGISKRGGYTSGDCWFGWYDWALVQDRELRRCHLIFTSHCSSATRRLVEDALVTEPVDLPYACGSFQRDEPASRYFASLQRIQEHILSGDCYQINYTQRFSATFNGSPAGAFESLRLAVPSPFSAYVRLPDGAAIMSISPERFIEIADRDAVTQPIKGTAPRGADAEADLWHKTQLEQSEKNRAENVMIVDLLRNDFSRVCQPHTVQTPDLFSVQTFANVHHLVSTVRGRLLPNVSATEFILSCFPGGSITGAPKKRAMQIIDDLELYGRGVYCGSIGYISARRSDFNIAIRTFYAENARIYSWGGGGIVADSDAEQEYEESLQKVRALCNALETGSRGNLP